VRVQLALGLIAQTGLAIALAADRDDWKAAGAGVAIGGALADVGLGALFAARWAGWTREMSERKTRYEQAQKRMREIDAEIESIRG
jgi:hypothetical protein